MLIRNPDYIIAHNHTSGNLFSRLSFFEINRSQSSKVICIDARRIILFAITKPKWETYAF